MKTIVRSANFCNGDVFVLSLIHSKASYSETVAVVEKELVWIGLYTEYVWLGCTQSNSARNILLVDLQAPGPPDGTKKDHFPSRLGQALAKHLEVASCLTAETE